jgi:hypothetical protein
VKLAEIIPTSFSAIIDGQLNVDKRSVVLLAELNSEASKSAQIDNPPMRTKHKAPRLIKMIKIFSKRCFFIRLSISLRELFAIT